MVFIIYRRKHRWRWFYLLLLILCWRNPEYVEILTKYVEKGIHCGIEFLNFLYILLNIESLLFLYLPPIFLVINALLVFLPIMVSVAVLTLVERKIMASIQRRRGPNIIGFWGLLQPFADGLKLLTKEFNIPARSFDTLILCTPMISLIFTCSCYALVPFFYSFLNFSSNYLSALFLMAISSLNIYSIIMAGWASKSVYAFLGSLRAAAQFISYEVSLTLNIMIFFLISGSFSLSDIAYNQELTLPNIIFFLPIFCLFLVGVLSETNRTPFDLAEAESELVAGYGVEFSAVGFAFFFIAEYGSIILYCFLMLVFFFSGVFSVLALVFGIFCVTFLLQSLCFIRATYARFRFDQLMKLNWKNLLIISLILAMFICFFLVLHRFW